MIKIYTKTGDKGKTSLFGGKRVSKSCLDIQVVGELDELNAVLGVVGVVLLDNLVLCHPERSPATAGRNEGSLEELVNFIQKIQKDLFKIGSKVASLQTKLLEKIEKVDSTRVEEMEKMIDIWSRKLPELNNFILPGGSLANAQLHLARAVCRRAERALVILGKQKKVRLELFVYLNRLSDWLFMAARLVNFMEGERENTVVLNPRRR